MLSLRDPRASVLWLCQGVWRVTHWRRTPSLLTGCWLTRVEWVRGMPSASALRSDPNWFACGFPVIHTWRNTQRKTSALAPVSWLRWNGGCYWRARNATCSAPCSTVHIHRDLCSAFRESIKLQLLLSLCMAENPSKQTPQWFVRVQFIYREGKWEDMKWPLWSTVAVWLRRSRWVQKTFYSGAISGTLSNTC